jgi:F-type H+-transporting ATPase subunit b
MTFNWWTFLFEALNFVVLAYVLHRLLYRPLREAIDKRREANARAEKAADKARQEAQALRQRLQEQLTALEQERQLLLHQARDQAETERQKVLAEAEAASQQRQEDVQQALKREREEALKSVRQEVIAQAIELTRRLLREASDRTLHQQLALHLAQTLEQMPDAQRELLRVNCQGSDGPVLESAQDLNADTLEQLTKAASAIMGQSVSLAVQKRAELLGGVRLRLGGYVWDGSLAGQLAAGDVSSKGNPSNQNDAGGGR